LSANFLIPVAVVNFSIVSPSPFDSIILTIPSASSSSTSFGFPAFRSSTK
jgi:hypothetical protein